MFGFTPTDGMLELILEAFEERTFTPSAMIESFFLILFADFILIESSFDLEDLILLSRLLREDSSATTLALYGEMIPGILGGGTGGTISKMSLLLLS